MWNRIIKAIIKESSDYKDCIQMLNLIYSDSKINVEDVITLEVYEVTKASSQKS